MAEFAYPIFPSVLAFDFARLGTLVSELEAAGAAGVHFDLMDNHFVPNLTFGPMVVQALRPLTRLPFHAHLMVTNAETLIEGLAAAGTARVYVHPEATPHIHRLLGQINDAGMEPAVAINPGTLLTVLEPILDLITSVLLMTVNPGFGGQAFIPGSLRRVAQLRAQVEARGLPVEIHCDGGVDGETIRPLVEAGMVGAVVGSALFRSGQPAATLQQLQKVAAGQ